jgi:hypothetical protein
MDRFHDSITPVYKGRYYLWTEAIIMRWSDGFSLCCSEVTRHVKAMLILDKVPLIFREVQYSKYSVQFRALERVSSAFIAKRMWF